jgi:hypothetical protein
MRQENESTDVGDDMVEDYVVELKLSDERGCMRSRQHPPKFWGSWAQDPGH